MKSWASLSLRIGLGTVFVAHGLGKAFGMFGGGGIAGFSKMLANLGFMPPTFWAYVVAYVELVGGFFLLIGFFSRITVIPLLVVMLVAALTVHVPKGFFSSQGGFEHILVIVSGLIALAILGSGKFGVTKH